MRFNAAFAVAVLSATATVSAQSTKDHKGRGSRGDHARNTYFATDEPNVKGIPLRESSITASIAKMVSKNILPKLSPGETLTLSEKLTSCSIDTNIDGTYEEKGLKVSGGVLSVPSSLGCSGTSGDIKSICVIQCEGGKKPFYGAFALESAMAKEGSTAAKTADAEPERKLKKREPKKKKKGKKNKKKKKEKQC
ncbi:hypothetical protein H072_11366 [Dactylellina haptotyla CBS 200.50]|uniref:Uncharacterized protein n=1 Tax=Dactylellina haptotyla (strain CBS 200.50) TaxID=1284197 RepID=S8A2A8_DACHA|nr:hypothetical protein H072_11366 [Dactylellina haptotyla CBS 200.50]